MQTPTAHHVFRTSDSGYRRMFIRLRLLQSGLQFKAQCVDANERRHMK